jgi:hypothetical protein
MFGATSPTSCPWTCACRHGRLRRLPDHPERSIVPIVIVTAQMDAWTWWLA